MAIVLSRLRLFQHTTKLIQPRVRRGSHQIFHYSVQCQRRQSRSSKSSLRIGSGQIRLLRGHRTRNGALYGDLEIFSLDSPELPSFYAVSYTWGLPTYTNFINVGSKQLPVLDSLSPFLHIAFDENPGKWWWIDSLCINQKDDLEKSCQIPLMDQIFQMAEKAIVWLGEKTADSDEALTFLEWLGWDFYCFAATHEWEWDVEKVAAITGPYRSQWAAVKSFFRRSW
jgi:hypothetical protein